MITPAVQAEIEAAAGRKIQAIAPLSAANNAQIYRLTMEGSGAVVAKVAERGLDTEAFMLKYLKEKTKLPVPAVLYDNEHVIVMEYIEGHYNQDALAIRNAADLLAELHKIRAGKYGFARDTLIGALRQPNAESESWTDFFATQRLLYMGAEAQKEGKIDARMMKQLEKLAGKLSQYITNPNPPSLVHGDIWGGNVIWGRAKINAFLDPAVYFADHEVELAFIRLFNTFDEAFFARYNEQSPIAPGFFEERADIYNLYPLLVHTRLFGASYARKARRILDKFA